ncbi:MAG TPA: response regulator [Candidatus Omnitrophota bacterium]|nr:response regulator [Candidatus Omnitrophota bacterium]
MPKKILIIDDEEGIVEEIEGFFRDEGYETYIAGTGQDGIAILKGKNPEIVLIDLKLPDISGLDVLKVAKDLNPSVCAIVNTGYVDQTMADQAEILGCDAFLLKPFDLGRLKQEVDRLSGGAP